MRKVDPTIQYAHGGKWHVMDGHGLPVEQYANAVSHYNERDGWNRWRVADRSTDLETGAPIEPSWRIDMSDPERIEEIIRLSHLNLEGTINEDQRSRMRDLFRGIRIAVADASDENDAIAGGDAKPREERTKEDGQR